MSNVHIRPTRQCAAYSRRTGEHAFAVAALLEYWQREIDSTVTEPELIALMQAAGWRVERITTAHPTGDGTVSADVFIGRRAAGPRWPKRRG